MAAFLLAALSARYVSPQRKVHAQRVLRALVVEVSYDRVVDHLCALYLALLFLELEHCPIFLRSLARLSDRDLPTACGERSEARYRQDLRAFRRPRAADDSRRFRR